MGGKISGVIWLRNSILPNNVPFRLKSIEGFIKRSTFNTKNYFVVLTNVDRHTFFSDFFFKEICDRFRFFGFCSVDLSLFFCLKPTSNSRFTFADLSTYRTYTISLFFESMNSCNLFSFSCVFCPIFLITILLELHTKFFLNIFCCLFPAIFLKTIDAS